MRETADKAYRNTLLLMMGLTRIISKADFSPPTKWLAVLENIRISSDILNAKLYEVDEDLGDEFVEKEQLLEKRLGSEKFYSQQEINDLKDKRNSIKIQMPRF